MVRWRFGSHLPSGDLRFYQQSSAVSVYSDHVTAAQTPVAFGCLIKTLGVSKGVRLPGQQPNAITGRLSKNFWTREPRQVEIARKIVNELENRDVITAPKRNVI